MSTGFYDLHNHTLPGVDDGARDMEMAVRMAAMAVEDGISTVLLTPHNRDVAGVVREGHFFERVEELRQAALREGIPIRFVVGMENHLEPDLPEQVERGLALPINGTQYILVELPFNLLPVYTDETLFGLQLKGLVPVIAHPERCEGLVRDPEKLAALVQRGMLAQVTASSIIGRFGAEARNAAELFLRRNLVHIIATDAHSSRGPRVPVISQGLEQAARIVGKKRAWEMATDIPEAVIEGLPVPAQPVAKRRRFFS